MKILKTVFLILFLFFGIKYSYAYDPYEKLDFFDKFHIYTPYIYILQDDTVIEEVKILVLFHNYLSLENGEQEIYDFAEESSKWESLTEKEKFFIMGFDFEDYDSFFNKENMDTVNKRILIEIDRMKNTCGTKDIKVYVAGTSFGGNIALLFNLLYNTFDGALCMNIIKPTKLIEKNLGKCKNKNFYFFHCDKNKDMSVSKIKSLVKKLTKKGAAAEIKIYKDKEKKGLLPDTAYSDAVDKITEK